MARAVGACGADLSAIAAARRAGPSAGAITMVLPFGGERFRETWVVTVQRVESAYDAAIAEADATDLSIFKIA